MFTLNYLITALQQSFGKVMFSVVCVCLSFCLSTRGPRVTTTHHAIGEPSYRDFPSPHRTVQTLPSRPHHTWTPNPGNVQPVALVTAQPVLSANSWLTFN